MKVVMLDRRSAGSRAMSLTALRSPSNRGFTLVEILIVVMILGILAMAVVPSFTHATTDAREKSLRESLQRYRTQVLLYRSQHKTYPGYFNGDVANAPEPDVFREQLLGFSNYAGAVSDTKDSTYCYGPYLPEMPQNPVNGLRTVKLDSAGTTQPTPDDSTGWIYQPSTGFLYANLTTRDSNGQPFIGY
jgi:prepilin-type N-terminal cleavage/methylation domain-containing protein